MDSIQAIFAVLNNKRFVRGFVSLLSCVLFLGCASFASNKTACDFADPMLPLPHAFVGNIFQISPCTSIEPLRIETGVELKQRGGVIDAVENKRSNRALEEFGYRMGCDHPMNPRFQDVLVANKTEIFGEKNERSDRQIVTSVRKWTRDDPELRKLCWE